MSVTLLNFKSAMLIGKLLHTHIQKIEQTENAQEFSSDLLSKLSEQDMEYIVNIFFSLEAFYALLVETIISVSPHELKQAYSEIFEGK